MKNYSITVTGHCPAPRAREYRIDASDFGTAINRAVKNYRKDIGRKVIERISVSAIVLGKIL
jgi:hypothetical protein